MPPSPPPPSPSDPAQRTVPTAKRRPPAAGAVRIKVDPQDLKRGDETLVERLKGEAKTGGVGVLVSLGVHLFFLVVFALIVITNRKDEQPFTMMGRWLSEAEKNAAKKTREPVQIEAVKIEAATPTPSKAAKKEAPQEPAEDPAVASLKPSEVSVGGALGGRSPGERSDLVKSSGGTGKTEQTVSQGLAWLLRQQKPDGHWELHQGYPEAGLASLKTDTGATALALLALLGAGYTHQQGPYQKDVNQAINWLKKIQKPNGDLHDWDELGRQTTFYAHGQATIALCEAYALTKDKTLLPPVQKALEFIYSAQHPVTGGWKYRPGSEGDLSVFGWQVMALESARMAGLEVPTDVLVRAEMFLDRVQEQNGARYKYEPTYPASRVTLAMTAEGLLCRQYLGWPRNHPSLQSGVKYLLQPQNLPNWSNGRRNVYFWYYATQVLHNLQGPEWEQWNTVLRDEIVKNQLKGAGKLGGSWHPHQPSGDPDEHADKGGRLYVTAMCVLIMEVYYRHLPLYR